MSREKKIGAACIKKGILLWRAGQLAEAEEKTREGLALLAPFEDQEALLDRIRASINLGNIWRDQERYPEAIERFETTVAECEAIGDTQGVADCKNNLGLCYYHFLKSPEPEQARLHRAQGLFLAAEALYREVEFEQGVGSALMNLGMVSDSLGDRLLSQRYYAEARTYAMRVGDLFNVALAWYNEGLLVAKLGKHEEALQMMRNGVTTFLRQGSPHYVGTALAEMGMILALPAFEPHQAVRYLAAADRCFREMKLTPLKEQHEDYAVTLQALEERIGAEAFQLYWNEGYSADIARLID